MEILADKLRPKILSDVIGQSHLIGENKILTNLVKNKRLFSMIFYGSPGTGKTSIATALVNELDLKYRFLNATINKKEDFDTVISEAKLYGELILVVDEIHRMNKDKQDLLLPYIENGLIILIGLTTANPYYKINPAIRSRCQIFELNTLSIKDLTNGIKKISKELDGCKITDEAIDYISNLSNGDMRFAINLLEIAYFSSSDKTINLELVKSINNKPILAGDANETSHYDLLSALQKSIRGSDVDASLHYLARLLELEDFDSIFRRLAVIVYEDIGLANVNIGPRLDSAMNFFNMVGMPEGRIIIGEVVCEMALSPKSNSAYNAINSAINDVKRGMTGPIPKNIIYNNTTYVYPHNYKNSYVEQNYMPDKLKGRKYYMPRENPVEDNINKAFKNMKDGKI